MNILIFTRSIPLHRIGGMEMLVWDFARSLVRKGATITIVTSSLPNEVAEKTIDGIKVFFIPGSDVGKYSKRFWTGTSEAYFLQNEQKRVDAIIGVSAAARDIALRGIARDVPIIMQAHGSSLGEIKTKWKRRTLKSIVSSLRNILWLFKDRAVVNKYDAVVCVSERVKEELQHKVSTLFSDINHVRVIRNGIDVGLFQYDRLARSRLRGKLGWEEAQVIVAACRLHAEKGVAELLNSFEIVLKSAPDTRLLVIGDGPELKALTSRVERSALAGKVYFSGALPRSEMAAWLSIGDVFAFLSLRLEGAPLNILEALSVTLPVVVSTDLVDRVPSPTGVWGVNPRDASQAARALLEALNSGVRSVLPDSYHIDVCAQEYIDLIETLTPST